MPSDPELKLESESIWSPESESESESEQHHHDSVRTPGLYRICINPVSVLSTRPSNIDCFFSTFFVFLDKQVCRM